MRILSLTRNDVIRQNYECFNSCHIDFCGFQYNSQKEKVEERSLPNRVKMPPPPPPSKKIGTTKNELVYERYKNNSECCSNNSKEAP